MDAFAVYVRVGGHLNLVPPSEDNPGYATEKNTAFYPVKNVSVKKWSNLTGIAHNSRLDTIYRKPQTGSNTQSFAYTENTFLPKPGLPLYADTFQYYSQTTMT